MSPAEAMSWQEDTAMTTSELLRLHHELIQAGDRVSAQRLVERHADNELFTSLVAFKAELVPALLKKFSRSV